MDYRTGNALVDNTALGMVNTVVNTANSIGNIAVRALGVVGEALPDPGVIQSATMPLGPGGAIGGGIAAAGVRGLAALGRLDRAAVAARVSTGAENVNAGVALNRKLSALEGAQKNAANVRQLPDGRVRYYEAERAAHKPGPTRSSSYVTEHNPANGNVRSWNESYDQAGNVNRVHPKMVNGQTVNSQHYPPTARELGSN